MGAKELLDLVSTLPTRPLRSGREVDFALAVVPEFFKSLGHDLSRVSFEPSFFDATNKRWVRPDAAVSTGAGPAPWIVLEVKLQQYTARPRLLREGEAQVRLYVDATRAARGVFLTPNDLIVMRDGRPRVFALEGITLAEATEIYEMLKPPAHAPASTPEPPPAPTTDTPTFRLQLTPYRAALDAVAAAATNDEKKTSLEAVAGMLFGAIPHLRVRRSNLTTQSSEIDLVVEYLGAPALTVFDEFGRFFIAECKNWSVAAGAPEVRNFLTTMEKTRCRLGVLFTRNGITGEKTSTDAFREIQSAFDRIGAYLVIVSGSDLEAIGRGANFYELIETRVFERRFDFRT